MTDGHVYPGGRVDRDDPRDDTLRRGFNLRWVGDPFNFSRRTAAPPTASRLAAKPKRKNRPARKK